MPTLDITEELSLDTGETRVPLTPRAPWVQPAVLWFGCCFVDEETEV